MSKAPDGRPIRVLRVIARLNMGGPALHVTYLAQGLAARGYETTLVAGTSRAARSRWPSSPTARASRSCGCPASRASSRRVRDAVAAWRVARIIRRVRPDVVHTHTAKAGAIGRVAALLARPWRRPVVVHTFHGHVLRGYFGHAGTLLFRAIETALARTTDRLVAVSPEVRDELVSLHVAPRAKFSVVRLGIELEPRVRFDGDPAEMRRRQGIAAHKFVVGWFGRMTAVKRTDDLLTMLAALRERGVDALLLLVGDGDDRERLEQRAHDLGLARSCLLVGYQEDVAPWYAICDAVVLTSVSEGTPVTIIEALAAGRPVVATRVGGVPDVVDEGETGFLVRPHDTHALAERLEILARDPERGAPRWAPPGASVRSARYSVERLVDDMDGLYRELLTPDTTSATSAR